MYAWQIENEYQHLEAAFKEEGTKYIHWAAKMAQATNIGVPWFMCKQTKAPGEVVTLSLSKCFQTFSITTYFSSCTY
jgi:hypothetical protein